MVPFPREKESCCFLCGLTPEDNRAVCQKVGNGYVDSLDSRNKEAERRVVMRKRWIVGVLAICFLLTGCKFGGRQEKTQEFPDGPMPGMDAQNQYIFLNAQGFYEAEDFFLWYRLRGWPSAVL